MTAGRGGAALETAVTPATPDRLGEGGNTTAAFPRYIQALDQWLNVIVRGIPVGQGNITTYARGHSVHGNAKTLKPWRNTVALAAEVAMANNPGPRPYPLTGPAALYVCFTVRKPVSAPKRRRIYPITRPDLSHLLRAVEDALTAAGVWRDDSQVVDERAVKAYPGEHPDALPVPGALIRIYPVSTPEEHP